MDLTIADHAYFFVIGIFLPLISLLSGRTSSEAPVVEVQMPPKRHIYYQNGLILIIGALLVLTIWNINERSWAAFGFVYPKITDMVVYMVVSLVVLYLADSIYTLYSTKKQKNSKQLMQVLPQSWSDYVHFIFLAVAAGVCEEIMFRGFMINYVLELTSGSSISTYLAVLIPSIIFSISHIYQGPLAVVKIFALSLLFGGIYIFSESLYIVIIIHVLVDLVSGALMVITADKDED